METNAFIGKPQPPSEDDLSTALGATRTLWDTLLRELAVQGAEQCEWSSYSAKAGWALKVICKKRVIVYLSPLHHAFRVSFALGDRAMEIARRTKVPLSLKKIIDEGKRYPEGTAIRFEVKSKSDVQHVLKLAAIKLGT